MFIDLLQRENLRKMDMPISKMTIGATKSSKSKSPTQIMLREIISSKSVAMLLSTAITATKKRELKDKKMI